MAEALPNRDQLLATSPTPIAQLSPSLDDAETRVVEGVVTVTWPFSIITRSIAFVLAEQDARLRRSGGQVRIEFHGAPGKALADAGVGGGDEIRLSLSGAKWLKPEAQRGLPGGTSEWQLKFGGQLRLLLRRLGSGEPELISIDGTEEIAEPLPEEAVNTKLDGHPHVESEGDPPTPLAHFSPLRPSPPSTVQPTKRLASTTLEPEEFASPAFLKRARVSYGSLFEGGIDALDEEGGRPGRKRKRPSAFGMNISAWKYSSRTPSPEPHHEEIEEDENRQIQDGHEATETSLTPTRHSMIDEGSQTQHLDFTPPASNPPSTEPKHLERGLFGFHPEPYAGTMTGQVASNHSDTVQAPAQPQQDRPHGFSSLNGVSAPEAVPGHYDATHDWNFGLAHDQQTGGVHQGEQFGSSHHPGAATDTSSAVLDDRISNYPTTTLEGVQSYDAPPDFTSSLQYHQMHHDHVGTGHTLIPEENSIQTQHPPEASDYPYPSTFGTTSGAVDLSQHAASGVRHPIEILDSSSPPREVNASWPTFTSRGDRQGEEAGLGRFHGQGEVAQDRGQEDNASPDLDGPETGVGDYREGEPVDGEDYDLRNYDHARADDQSEDVSSSEDQREEGDAVNFEEDYQGQSDDEEGVEYAEGSEEGYESDDNMAGERPMNEYEGEINEEDISGEEYDEEEEEEYDEDVDDEAPARAQPSTQPVVISLLSDSEDEEEEDSQLPPSKSPQAIEARQDHDETEGQLDFDATVVKEELEAGSDETHHTKQMELVQRDGEHDEGQESDSEAAPVAVTAQITSHSTRLTEQGSIIEEYTEETHQIFPQHALIGEHDLLETPLVSPSEVLRSHLMEDNIPKRISQTTESHRPSDSAGQDDSVIDAVEPQQPAAHESEPQAEEFGEEEVNSPALSDAADQVAAAELPSSPPSTRVSHSEPTAKAPVASDEDQRDQNQDLVQQLPTPSETQLEDASDKMKSQGAETKEFRKGPDADEEMDDVDEHGPVPDPAGQETEPLITVHSLRSHDYEKEKETETSSVQHVEAVQHDEAGQPREEESADQEKEPLITVHSLRSHDYEKPESETVVESDGPEAGAHPSTSEERPAEQEKEPLITVHSLRSHDDEKANTDSIQEPRDGANLLPTETPPPVESDKNNKEDIGTTTVRVTRRKKALADPSVQLALATPSTPKGTRRQPAQGVAKHTRSSSGNLARHQTPDTTTGSFKSPSIVSSQAGRDRSAPGKTQLLKQLRETLPDYLPLKRLRPSLGKTIDVLGVSTTTPPKPHRPKHGPRDYMLELIITDPSIAPSGVVVVQLYRPHQHSLPIVHAGDIVLLRRFDVLSLKDRDFGIRAGDGSSWAIYEKGDVEFLPQIKGPPVETSQEEFSYVEGLRQWWDGIGAKAEEKVKTASQKMLEAAQDSNK